MESRREPGFSQPKTGRRQFLLLTGGALGASVVSCSGPPADTIQPSVNFVSTTYGEASAVNKRILVAYASEKGSTSGVADAIGKQLAAGGATVDVRRVTDVADLGAYRAAVIGSAIHGGKWLPEAIEFLQDNQSRLNQMPTAIFAVCITMARNKPTDRQDLAKWLDAPRQLTKPVGENLFAGAVWLSDYPGAFNQLSMRALLLALGVAEGDHRDLSAARAWADEMRPRLL